MPVLSPDHLNHLGSKSFPPSNFPHLFMFRYHSAAAEFAVFLNPYRFVTNEKISSSTPNNNIEIITSPIGILPGKFPPLAS